jgi:hypothetical protein
MSILNENLQRARQQARNKFLVPLFVYFQKHGNASMKGPHDIVEKGQTEETRKRLKESKRGEDWVDCRLAT